MRRVVSRALALALAMVAAVATVSMAQAQQSASSTPGVIEVNGRGEIMVEPDEFKFTITIDQETTKGRVTISEAERQMVAALTELGVDSSQALRMRDVASGSERRRNEVRTSAVYDLTLNEAAQVRQFISALNTLSISRVDLASTTHTDIEGYRSQARKLAVEDAVAKANELSAALGRGEVEFVRLKEYASHNNYAQPLLMRADAAMGGQATTPMEFAPIAVRCEVEAEFFSSKK